MTGTISTVFERPLVGDVKRAVSTGVGGGSCSSASGSWHIFFTLEEASVAFPRGTAVVVKRN